MQWCGQKVFRVKNTFFSLKRMEKTFPHLVVIV